MKSRNVQHVASIVRGRAAADVATYFGAATLKAFNVTTLVVVEGGQALDLMPTDVKGLVTKYPAAHTAAA